MKGPASINNVHNLEKEIYRLKLQARKIEEKLDHNLQYLQQKGFSMAARSFCPSHCDKEKANGFRTSFLSKDLFHTAIGTIAAKAAEILVDRVEKILNKKSK